MLFSGTQWSTVTFFLDWTIIAGQSISISPAFYSHLLGMSLFSSTAAVSPTVQTPKDYQIFYIECTCCTCGHESQNEARHCEAEPKFPMGIQLDRQKFSGKDIYNVIRIKQTLLARQSQKVEVIRRSSKTQKNIQTFRNSNLIVFILETHRRSSKSILSKKCYCLAEKLSIQKLSLR